MDYILQNRHVTFGGQIGPDSRVNDKLFPVYLINGICLYHECTNEPAEKESGLFYTFFGILLLKGTFRDLFVTNFFLFFSTDQPEIITHPKNVTIEERLLMTLFCNATGNPPPTISWTKDGSPLTKTQGIIFTGDNETLSIANITRSESGNYRCVTRNSLGNDTSNAAKVDVLCKCSINYFLFCLISKENFY